MINTKQLSAFSIGAIATFWLSLILFFLCIPSLMTFFYTEKSITILTWPSFLDAHYLQNFEKETGIKVHLRYVESNEELYVKLKETKGEGYDLIMPSDYMIELLRNENILKKVEMNRLPFAADFYPHLINNYYDPLNEYAIPYFWSMYGIAYNKNHFKDEEPHASWALIFDEKIAPKHLCMIDGARELVQIAAQYLYGKQIAPLSQEQIARVKAVLVNQKKLVELYTEDRANFLLASNTSPLAVSVGAVAARIMRNFDNIKFIIPQEGSFLNVDAFVIPKKTTKDDLIYAFLNYVYKEEVLKHHIAKYGFFSPLTSVTIADSPVALPTQKQIEKADFFRNILSRNELSDIWIAIKS